jgi:hypothetical protein
MDLRHTMMLAVIAVGGAAVADQPQDPRAFFDAVADRYRQLVTYEDTVDVIEIVTRDDGAPHRVQTRLSCRLENGRLYVDSAASQVRSGAVDAPLARSPGMASLVLRYNLWIAPHMVLHFKENPLAEFRLGVPQGFTPTRAEPVTVDDRELIYIELKAADPPDNDSADATEAARFELWVNPGSMLIERIRGRQTMPDGAAYETMLEITPLVSDP